MSASKEIYFTQQAQHDADGIAEYIVQDNFEAAERFYEHIKTTCLSLSVMPKIGKLLILNNRHVVI